MTTDTTASTLDRAHHALRDAVSHLDSSSLALPTPCTQWTVAQVVEHAVLDQGIWATAVGDAAPPEGDAFAPTGELPTDVVAMVGAALDAAANAWAHVAAGSDRVASPLPQGELDVEPARNAAALDAAVHAWDIAVAVGAAPVLDDELSAELLPTAQALVEPLRQWGAYAAVVPAPGDDAPTGELLRYLGRDPKWSAVR